MLDLFQSPTASLYSPPKYEVGLSNEAPTHQAVLSFSHRLRHCDRYIGLVVAFAGGGVYAFFAPAFNVATNDNFGLLAPGVPPLSIYATDFYFAAGFTGISLVRRRHLLRLAEQDLRLTRGNICTKALSST